MPKQSKLSTPDWIKEGFDSKQEYEKSYGIKKEKKIERAFKIRQCPKCKSNDVNVILTGEEGKGIGEWECRKCNWRGFDIVEKELSEDEFMKYLDEKGEEIP